MITKDLNALANIDFDDVKVNNDLQEVTTHGNLDFPVSVHTLRLSEMYLNRIRWHWHTEFEMIYMKEGKMNVLIDEESFTVEAGQGFMVNQNVLHSYRQIEDRDPVFYAVVFHPAIIFGYGNSTLSLKYLSPIAENPSLKCTRFDSNDHLTSSILEQMLLIHALCNSAESGYELVCKSLFCNIWNLFLRIPRTDSAANVKSKRLVNDEQRIKDAIRYIVQNYADPITLDDIAKSIHVSKSECCRCFQRILQQTPFEYLQKYRILHAAKLIQQQDPKADSISNLAISVGFGNISYFNKVFRRYMHMTPTEFKRGQTHHTN